MANDAAVDQTQNVSTTADTTKSETTTTDQSKTDATQRPDPAQGTKGGDDVEKRFKGIQADLAKERKARQGYEQKLQQQDIQYKAELAAERKRIAALAGINVPTTEEAEAEDIRQRLGKVATSDWLLSQLGLTKEDLADFKTAREDRSRLSDMEQHYWGKHGQSMVGQVTKELAKEYGGELSKRQIDTITQAYVLRAQVDPEFLSRHEAGDEKLITDFAKEWLEDWFEPAKRRITATEVDRFRRVPSGKDRNLVTSGEKKIDVTDTKQVEDLLVAGFKERGGQFRR